jgi:DNA-binding NtrC family response regulator
VERFCARYEVRRRLSAEALEIFRSHAWPGNVRELLHVVEAAMVVCEGPEILPEHLPVALRQRGMPFVDRRKAASPEPLLTLLQVERNQIERTLKATGGHRGESARILGISERNLYRKLKEYGLADPGQFSASPGLT